MTGIAVIFGKHRSVHLRDVPTASLDEVPSGRGALVRVLPVGVDGTDAEINAAEYGAPPPGQDYLDLVLEGSGHSPLVFDAMQGLAKNGVLVLTSVTGRDRTIEIPSDRLRREFVLGNRVMVGSVTAGRESFETGVRDIAHAESVHPGWLSQLLTHRVQGLERYRELFAMLESPDDTIKIFRVVAPL